MLSTALPLSIRLGCPVFEPGDPGYAAEVAAFHTNTVHTPDLVIGAEETADVVDALRIARERGYRVSVQSGGHAGPSVRGGLLINTRRMKRVSVDPDSRVATIGGGAKWSDVLPVAGAYGLMPVIGSTSDVGVAGYLLGGGISPIARSHGFSSDYALGFTVVTGDGEVVDANADLHPDLFWALRGGKAGFGIVTEVRLRLVEMTTIYAGSLVFEEEQIEAAFRGWLDWTADADPMVTTSSAIMSFPDMEMVPPPFRGKRLLMLRFAYPGDAAQGEVLAAPLRALAPVFLDDLGEIPAVAMDRVHNDPTDPIPAWAAGAQLGEVDGTFATRWLERFGAGTANPFAMAELRHGGGAARLDVPGGSAVTGRDASFTMFLAAMYPPLFEVVAPAAFREAMEAMAPWLLPVANVNLIAENTVSTPWPPEVAARLDQIRDRYDPDGAFTLRW